jgi:DNA primase
MAGLISQDLLDEILNKIDIVEVVTGYIPLKRAGRNFRALCPFHQEKTPSFMVSPDRQIYHCFGCSSGGNAFNFLMKYERLEFPEAVEVLAKKAGVRLPEEKQDSHAASINQQIYKVLELAELFYRNSLNSVSASAVKGYLLKRNINEEAARLFRLGFAPDNWDALINALRSKGISLSLMEKAGLIISKSGGGYYDRFRNRVIFPILDVKSRVIAFGARVLPGSAAGVNDSQAKYVNSPETPIYTKGRNLYNLNNALKAIRELDFAVIVEGYLDCILPYQQGLHNIVASLGTALTNDQVKLLKRYTDNVVMVYDGDAAGEIAAVRSLDIFVEEGVNVKVVALPAGHDPDSFVRKNGIGHFQQLIQAGSNLFDYKLRVLRSRYNAGQIEGKALIAQEMLVTINKFNNAILKFDYIKRLSEELDVKEEALRLELGKIKDYRPAAAGSPPAAGKAVNINPTEKLLIKLMLEEASVGNRLKDYLEPADFQDERTTKIVSIMFDLLAQGKKVNSGTLINHLEPHQDLSAVISGLSLLPDTCGEDREKVIDDCVCRLKKQRLKTKRDFLQREIKNAQNIKDDELLRRLMQEFHCITKNFEQLYSVKNKATDRGEDK